MLSTLRWAGKAANANSLADPNATFDPTLSCVSGEEAARDTLVYADVPKSLEERSEKKPQDIRVSFNNNIGLIFRHRWRGP